MVTQGSAGHRDRRIARRAVEDPVPRIATPRSPYPHSPVLALQWIAGRCPSCRLNAWVGGSQYFSPPPGPATLLVAVSGPETWGRPGTVPERQFVPDALPQWDVPSAFMHALMWLVCRSQLCGVSTGLASCVHVPLCTASCLSSSAHRLRDGRLRRACASEAVSGRAVRVLRGRHAAENRTSLGQSLLAAGEDLSPYSLPITPRAQPSCLPSGALHASHPPWPRCTE